jgi:hypothetical protein
MLVPAITNDRTDDRTAALRRKAAADTRHALSHVPQRHAPISGGPGSTTIILNAAAAGSRRFTLRLPPGFAMRNVHG